MEAAPFHPPMQPSSLLPMFNPLGLGDAVPSIMPPLNRTMLLREDSPGELPSLQKREERSDARWCNQKCGVSAGPAIQ